MREILDGLLDVVFRDVLSSAMALCAEAPPALLPLALPLALRRAGSSASSISTSIAPSAAAASSSSSSSSSSFASASTYSADTIGTPAESAAAYLAERFPAGLRASASDATA